MLSSTVVKKADLLDLQTIPIDSNYFSYSRCKWSEDKTGKDYFLKKMKLQSSTADTLSATKLINNQFNTLKQVRAKHPAFLSSIAFYMEQDAMLLGIVTEHCEHGNVFDFTSALSAMRQSLSPWILSAWLRQIADGFQYLHESERPPICHGNFSSKHILITAELTAKISGFDSATSGPLTSGPEPPPPLLDDRLAYGLACFEALALASPRRTHRNRGVSPTPISYNRIASLLSDRIRARWPAESSALIDADIVKLVALQIGGEQRPADRPAFVRAIEVWSNSLVANGGDQLLKTELQKLNDFLTQTDSLIGDDGDDISAPPDSVPTPSVINVAKLQLPPNQLITPAQLSRLCCCPTVQAAFEPLLLLLGLSADELEKLRLRGEARRQQADGQLFEGLQLLQPLTSLQLVRAMRSVGCYQGIDALCDGAV